VRLNPKNIKRIFDSINSSIKTLSKDPYRLTVKNEDPLRCKMELSTFKISLPRGTGNTFLAKKFFKKYKDSFFVTYCRLAMTAIRVDFKKEDRRILSANMILKGLSCRIIIADPLYMLTEKQIRNLYDAQADFFILLG
jgi:hypothetical protein